MNFGLGWDLSSTFQIDWTLWTCIVQSDDSFGLGGNFVKTIQILDNQIWSKMLEYILKMEVFWNNVQNE